MKGKMVLEARGFEKILSSKLADLYHKNYVVSYQEEITQEMIEQYQAHTREVEKQAIMLAQKEAMEQAEEKRQSCGFTFMADSQLFCFNNYCKTETTIITIVIRKLYLRSTRLTAKIGHGACPSWARCFLIMGTLLAPDGQIRFPIPARYIPIYGVQPTHAIPSI